MDLSAEFTFPVSGVTAKNRICKAAMTECLAHPKTNDPNDKIFRLYETWGRSEAGIILTGNVMIDRNCMESPRNVVLDDKSDLSLFRKWADTVHNAGNSLLLMQVSHAGRQCPRSVNNTPVAPSAVAVQMPGLPYLFGKPRALTAAEIENVRDGYVRACVLADQAGFDGVELHGAHGYLLSQFLSPRANRRTDEWGGTPENRRRLLREVVSRVRKQTNPRFIVGVKLNSADFKHGGFSEDESLDVVRMLEAERVDFVEISGGTYEAPEMLKLVKRETSAAREAFFIEFAEKLRSVTSLPRMVTGGWRTRAGMQQAVRNGTCQLIGVARPMCAEPHFPRELLAGRQDSATAYGDLTFYIPAVDRVLGSGLNTLWHEMMLQSIGSGREPDFSPRFATALYILLVVLPTQYFCDPAKHPLAVQLMKLALVVLLFVLLAWRVVG